MKKKFALGLIVLLCVLLCALPIYAEEHNAGNETKYPPKDNIVLIKVNDGDVITGTTGYLVYLQHQDYLNDKGVTDVTIRNLILTAKKNTLGKQLLTLTQNREAITVTLSEKNTLTQSNNSSPTIQFTGDATITGSGELTCSTEGTGSAIKVGDDNNYYTLTIKGGTVTAKSGSNVFSYGISVYGKLFINGGTLKTDSMFIKTNAGGGFDLTLPEYSGDLTGNIAWKINDKIIRKPGEQVAIEASSENKILPVQVAEIQFDPNGGTGSMESVLVELENGNPYTYTLPDCGFTKPNPNMSFKGWSLSKNGDVLNGSITLDEAKMVTLYAIWNSPSQGSVGGTGNVITSETTDTLIISPSENQTIQAAAGERVTLTVNATPDAMSFQWFIDRNDGKGFVTLEGANGASYTTSPLKAGNNGYRYYCAVSNGSAGQLSPFFTLKVGNGAALPATGDASMPMLWAAAMLLAAAGIAFIVKRGKTV